jgi:hypothetical protein
MKSVTASCNRVLLLAHITLEVNRSYIKTLISDALEQHVNDLTTRHILLPYNRVTTPRMKLCLTAIVTGLLLSIMPLLTGCGGGGETGSARATASLSWDAVPDPSVSAYFVHYGRHSAGQVGSCAYESSIHADSPSATVTDLDPNTVYYFAVSAYDGHLESACSNEVSAQTPPAST